MQLNMTINKYYILPIFATGLLITTLIINEFRFGLFGIMPGYAPHNFGFNMFFFLPSTIVSLVCAIIVLIRRPQIENKKTKLYSVLLVIPIFMLWTWQLIRMSKILNY